MFSFTVFGSEVILFIVMNLFSSFNSLGAKSLKDLQNIDTFELKSKLSEKEFSLWLQASREFPYTDADQYELIQKLWFELEREREPWTSG